MDTDQSRSNSAPLSLNSNLPHRLRLCFCPRSQQRLLNLMNSEKQREWTRFLLFVPGAITFGLGTWQIFRRQDKMKMEAIHP